MWSIEYNKTGPQGRTKLTNGVGAMSGGQACQWSLLHSLHWADPACLQTQAELHRAAHPTGAHKPNMLGSGHWDNFQTQLNPVEAPLPHKGNPLNMFSLHQFLNYDSITYLT